MKLPGRGIVFCFLIVLPLLITILTVLKNSTRLIGTSIQTQESHLSLTPLERKAKYSPNVTNSSNVPLKSLPAEPKLVKMSRNMIEYRKFPTMWKYCTPELCLSPEDLSWDEDRKRHESCFNETISYIHQQRSLNANNIALTKCSCRLKSGKKTYRKVALVSLPGSGNTWVRGLIEHATGVCTAAMWCDPNLRATQFCGEGLHSAKALVIKNHDATIRWRGESLRKGFGFSEHNKPEFDAAILVHRNPFDAIVAERNRAIGLSQWLAAVKEHRQINSITNQHVQHFGAEYFGENPEWKLMITKLMDKWENMINHLLINNRKHSVLVVRYEDLKSNALHEVMRMLEFLDYAIPEHVQMKHKEFTTFYRNHTSTFEHFTRTQRIHINGVIMKMHSKLKSEILTLKDYVNE